MKKLMRERLQARLDKALEPPRAAQVKADNSDSIVGRYTVPDDVPKPAGSTSSANQTGTTAISGSTDKTGSTKKIGITSSSGSTHKSKATPLFTKSQAIAPERDFQRVPNSVTREAMTARLFRGKSKQVWDYLWSVSRGAIVPTRTIRRSRPQIKTGAGLGSMGTVDSALEHLQQVCLISIKTIVGESGGNEYEVFTPEEAASSMLGATSLSGTTNLDGSTGSTQNSVLPVVPEFGSTGSSLSEKESTTSEQSKTFFKTKEEKTDDDAALALLRQLQQAERELIGKTNDPSKWSETLEVILAELKIAAARTTISSVPAFLAEHLRRRLWKIDKHQARAEGRELPDEATNSQPGVDAHGCPDCSGSGWWYPEGSEKGVAKCKHENMLR
jgi:hypothetical protein